MPMTMAKTGETVTIRKITGKDEIRQHLVELGFVVGSNVTVVKLVRDKRNGKSSCSSNCAHCAMSGSCHSHKK